MFGLHSLQSSAHPEHTLITNYPSEANVTLKRSIHFPILSDYVNIPGQNIDLNIASKVELVHYYLASESSGREGNIAVPEGTLVVSDNMLGHILVHMPQKVKLGF